MASIILSVMVAWLFVQVVFKPLIASMRARRLALEAIWWQGGMPSGHAALAGGLCAAVGKVEGLASPVFAVALAFSALVIYDALATRNILGEHSDLVQSLTDRKIKRIHGHGVWEVVVGVFIGGAVAYTLV